MTGRRNRAHAPKQTLACKAFRRRNAGRMPRAKKRDIFPAGKVWFLPPRPRRYFPHGNSRRESRYLAQKRDKYFDAISRQIFLPFGFLYGSKNWLAKIFGFSEQPYNSVRTSLVRCSICLWEVFSGEGRRVTGASKVPPPTKFLENFCLRGVENTAVSPRCLQRRKEIMQSIVSNIIIVSSDGCLIVSTINIVFKCIQ